MLIIVPKTLIKVPNVLIIVPQALIIVPIREKLDFNYFSVFNRGIESKGKLYCL